METLPKAREMILKEITSDDLEVRAKFLEKFAGDVAEFANAMAKAYLAWQELDAKIGKNEKLGYISALVFTAITLHIQSMKLFLSGLPITAGNLFRQTAESIALALLCSGKELDVLDRFMEGKYSTNKAIKDVINHSDKLDLLNDGVVSLQKLQVFYHKFSHPTRLTIASLISFTGEGGFLGAFFDDGKLATYEKEMRGRVELAKAFFSFVEGVKANINKW